MYGAVPFRVTRQLKVKSFDAKRPMCAIFILQLQSCNGRQFSWYCHRQSHLFISFAAFLNNNIDIEYTSIRAILFSFQSNLNVVLLPTSYAQYIKTDCKLQLLQPDTHLCIYVFAFDSLYRHFFFLIFSRSHSFHHVQQWQSFGITADGDVYVAFV